MAPPPPGKDLADYTANAGNGGRAAQRREQRNENGPMAVMAPDVYTAAFILIVVLLNLYQSKALHDIPSLSIVACFRHLCVAAVAERTVLYGYLKLPKNMVMCTSQFVHILISESDIIADKFRSNTALAHHKFDPALGVIAPFLHFCILFRGSLVSAMARPRRIALSQPSAFLLFLLVAAFFACVDARIRIPRFPASFHRQQKSRANARKANSVDVYNEPATPGASARGGYAWNASYFTQNLDHFSFTQSSYATWQQKYIWWDGAWGGAESGAPIFVYCGNEGPIQWFMDNAGWIREIAVEFGALVVGPEHRYYGESMPFGTEKESFSNASTRAFLTTEQAMADMAVFLTALKANLSAHDSPVILFGGSYGGMLAAWFRLKYPHIAAGAIAASAPILQYEDIVPSDTFYRIISHDFKIESESCFEAINSSWAAIREQAAAEGGLTRLSEQFRLCSPLTDVEDLIQWLETAYIYMAMVDYPVPSDFLMSLPAHPIRELCRRVDSLPPGADLLDRIYAGVGVYYNYSGSETCFSVRDTDPHDMSNGWDFQACTEHVMPMSSSASNSLFEPFEWNQTAFEKHCLQQYGVAPRPTWAMTQFGGRSIRSALRHFGSNIVFSQGALDPWSGGGVLEDISDTLVSLTIPDGAHHLDLRASTPDDPPSVRKQRKEEKKHVRKWIKQWHKDREEEKKDKEQGRNGLRCSSLSSFKDISSTSLALFVLSLALLATSVAVSLFATHRARPIGTTYSPALHHPLMGGKQ
ncbi:unnamed protein product [Closterium sp. Yama58-4]|nr:unnamed protein product [Closterium sp. Yama58-4]